MSSPGSAGGCESAFHVRVDSDPARLAPTRKAVEAFARACGLDEQAANDLGLCLNEVMANVTRHAYGGRTDGSIEVTAKRRPDGAVSVTVRDWGSGIDPSSCPRSAYNPLTPGGLGLVCLDKLLDEMVYSPQPDGMLATLVKKNR